MSLGWTTHHLPCTCTTMVFLKVPWGETVAAENNKKKINYKQHERHITGRE